MASIFFWGEKMNLFSVFLVGLGLSMDAFAAAICKGLAIKKNFLEKSFVIALLFGVFQALMPYIGYLLGSIFCRKASSSGSLDCLYTLVSYWG